MGEEIKFTEGQEIDEATYNAWLSKQSKQAPSKFEFKEGQEIDEATYNAWLSKQQKQKQPAAASPKASVTKPPTPMQGESTVDAALREAEAETAQEGYSAPKAPSPDTIERFSVEEPPPTFWDSPFPVPGAGMVRAQELNQKLKIANKQIKALEIKAQAGTLTEQERQQGLKTIEEAKKTQELFDDEIEMYNNLQEIESARIRLKGLESEAGKVIPSKTQGDLVEIKHGGIPSLKRVKNDAFWDNTRGGWWFDETTPAPDTAYGYNPPVVNQKLVEAQAANAIRVPGISIGGPVAQLAAKEYKVKELAGWLQDKANQTTWVERNGRKMLIRVGDGAERMQNVPEGEGFYRTEVYGMKNDGTPDIRLIKVDEVLNPEYSRDAIKAKKEFKKKEIERLYAEQSTLGTQTRKAAVSIVKGATTLLGMEEVSKKLQDKQDIYTEMLKRDLQFRSDGVKDFAMLMDQSGTSVFEVLASVAAGAPIASLAEFSILSRIAQPVTKIGMAGRFFAGRSVYGLVDSLPETVQMVNGDRWQLEAKMLEDGHSPQTSHDISCKNASRLALQNMLISVPFAWNPFSFGNAISKGFRSTFSEGTKRAFQGAFEQTAEELAEMTQKKSWKRVIGEGTIAGLTQGHLQEQPQNGLEALFDSPFDVEHNNFFNATGKALRLAYATKDGWKEAFKTYPVTFAMGFAGAAGQGRAFTKSGKAMLESAQTGAATPAWIPEALEQKITAFNEAMSGVVNHLEAAKAKGEPVSPLDEARVKNIEKLVETVNETGDITMLDERVAIAMNPTAVVGKSGQDYLEHAGVMTEFLMAANAAGADTELLSRHTASFRAINDVVEQATKEHLDAVEATKTQDIAAVDTKEHRRKVALAETTKHKARVAAAKAIETLKELQPKVFTDIQDSIKQAKEDLLNPFGEEEMGLGEVEELDVELPTPEAVQQPTDATRPVSDGARIFAKSGYEGNLSDADVRSIYEERITALNKELDALVNADEGLLEDPEASQILNELPIDLADLTEREYKGNLQPESRLKYGTREYQDARSIIETKLNRLKEIAASRQGEVNGQGSQAGENEVSGTNVSAGVTSDASKDRLPIKIGEYGRIEIADAKKEFADWIKVNDFTDEASGATASPTIVTTETLKDNCSLVSLDNGTKAFVGVSPNGLGIDMFVFGDSMGKEAYSVNIGFAGEATTSDRVYVDYILSKSRATGKIVNAGSSGMGALCYSTVAKIINASLPNVKILDGLIAAKASFIARSRFKGSKFIIKTSHLETPIENLVDMQLLDKFDETTKSRLAHIYNKLGFHNDLKLTGEEKASLLGEYEKIMSGAVVKRSIVTNPVRLKAHLLGGSDNAYYAVTSKELPWEKDSRMERFRTKARGSVKTEVILPEQKKAEANVVVEPKAIASFKPIKTPKAKIDTTKPVKEQLKTMLLNTGLYTEEDAAATAEVCGRVNESLANALRVDPIWFFNKYGIKKVVVGEELDGALHQTGFHGGGVDFDKFSLDFVGAGEGGKKFGWGVYVTQDRRIAESYRRIATKFQQETIKVDGVETDFSGHDANVVRSYILPHLNPGETTTIDELSNYILKKKELYEKSLKDSKRESDKAFFTALIEGVSSALELLSKFDKSSEIKLDKPSGQLYEVDVPEDERLLNLYKHLDQQPEYIQERIKDVVEKYNLNYARNNGWDLYLALTHGIKSTENLSTPGDNHGLSEDNYRAASLILGELGIEGLTFRAEGGTGGRTGDVHNFVVFNADAVNIIKKYHQENRGSIVFGDKEIKISLLKNMDKSTFLHEFGHYILEVMGDIIDSGKGSEQLKKDYAVLLRFLGVKKRSDIKIPQHEKLARAWEKYLGQGKAPVKELEGIFKMFSKWFTAIYKTLSALDVRLSKDVKEVFDRLVTPESIKTTTKEDVGTIAKTSLTVRPKEFAQSPVTKVTIDGKTHEVTAPDKVASLTAAKTNADVLQDGVRQNTELSKEEKHDLHIQVGNAHRDYKKAVIENERINRVPTNISDALGIKGIDWFYATTDTYLKAINAAGVKNAEGLRKLLKSKGLAPMDVDTGVALFESFNTFGDNGSNPVAGVEANASAKKDTSKQIEVAAKGAAVIAKALVPENAEKAIKESGVKPETEKSVSEIKNNPKAFGSILHTFANRAVFALLDSRMSNLSKRVKAFVADMVATKNKFAETYQVMSEVKGVDNKRLGFMLGWTTVNERHLTKDEFHKMYPQSPDKVYEAYVSALEAMKVGRDTILDAAKNMNDQVMKRLEARQGVLLDRFTELQDQIEEANKEGKSGSKEMIELKNKLRGEELSRTRVENQIKEQKDSYKELVDILSKREFYWPLSRFGKFKVEVKDKKTGERVGIFFMEDKSEASKAKLLEDIKLQALADAALGEAFKNDRLSVGSPLELVDLGDDITGQSPFNVDGAMLSFLDAAQKISEDAKGELEAAVMSAKAMETLKNHMKERKGIPGWSTDAFKVFDTYIHSLASNVANMKHSLLMDDELKKFTQENAGENYDSKLHATARGFVEHAKRPPDHKWVNTVLGTGFVMHIGARASFAVAQLGQLAGSVYPALGQFYGYINAMQAITAALPIAIGTVGWTQIDKFELITKENVTKWVNERMSPSAFRMASSDPKVREHIATVCKEMVVRAADSGSLQAAPTFGFADNIIKSAGEQIASKAGVIALKFEQINRLTTLISWGILNATKGEVKLSDSTGFIKETTASTQEKIISGDKATIDNIYDVGETVNELSNIIRGRGNQPKYLRYRGAVGAALRLAFNYKSFPIGWLAQFHTLGLLSARKAGGGKFKQTLAYARPQLVGMGIQALLAGPRGIIYFKLLEMLLSAFDEPEEWMLNFFEEVSKELHKVIRKGMKAIGMDPDKNKELAIYLHHACINGLPAASGIDPSAMFEGDLVTVKGSTLETVGNFFMGATGSSFAAAIDKTFKTGSIVEGMKMLTPSAIKGPIEAISGETSVGGGKVELTKFGRAARALGFQPTSVQIQRDALNTKFKVQSFVRSQGKEFATEFAKFYGGGKNPDNESIEELKKEVKDFNTRNKELLEKYNVRGISASEIMIQAKSARRNLKVSDRIVQEGVSARDEE